MADWTAITGIVTLALAAAAPTEETTEPDWTAITGIVVSGVVGPSVVALWAALRQKREAKSALALADRAAARTLLDEAARAVREAIGRTGPVRTAAMTWGNKLGIEGGADEVKAYRTAGQAVDLLGPRIEIMFGRGKPVSEAFGECVAAVDRIAGGANGMAGAHEIIDWRPYHEDIREGSSELDEAHKRFLEAAHEAVGVD